ncbi:MAG: DoxX family protein [Flavobacteriales bacterium]
MKPTILKLAVYISRLIVGSLFIISGLIKMNDSFGFSYKLQEYFSEKALGFPDLIPYSLGIAVFICIAEVLLGVAVLVWAKQKLSSALILILILFFTWLTFYTHSCDPFEKVMMEIGGEMLETTRDCVTACGCFGNAIPLTPYQSFQKDLFLLIWTIILVVYAFFFEKKEHFDLSNKKNKREYLILLAVSLLAVALFSLKMLDWLFPVIFTVICLFVAEFIRRRSNSVSTDWIVALAVTVVCCIFAYVTYDYLPMKDYRPYAIGQNITENMKSAEDLGLEGPVYAIEYTVTNKATGKDSIMLSSDWLKVESTDWFKDTYEEDIMWDGREILVKDGYSPLIADFAPMDFFGDNKMEEVLSYEGHTLIIVSKDISELMKVDSTPFVSMYEQAQKDGYRMIALVNGATKEQIMTFQQKSGLNFTFYSMDDVELKTIIRSNPGLVHMKNATIMNKWSWKGLPDYSEISFD